MKVLTKFNLFLVIVFSSLVLPPIVPKTSIRVDTIAIFFYSFLLLSSKIPTFSKTSKFVITSFFSLTLGAGIALLMQAFLLGKPYILEYAYNFQGYLRPLLFAFVTVKTVKSIKQTEILVRLILFGIIFHGLIALIQYIRLEPYASYINLLYRGDLDEFGYVRGLGAFAIVHGLGYFGLYGLIFSLAIITYPCEKFLLRKLSYIALVFSLVSLIVPFSRGAWIAAAISTVFLTLNKINWKTFVSSGFTNKFVKKIFIAIPLLALVAYFFPANSDFIRLTKKYANDILVGIQYLTFNRSQSFENLVFIQGRLDWGWANALEVFRNYPLHGDLSARYVTFIGDGGYTESLSNHGFIGFISILFLFFTIWMAHSRFHSIEPLAKAWINVSLRSFVIAFAIAMIPTTMLQERSIELLPVMLISLVSLSKRSFEEPKRASS
jgi:hypothetical protein